MSSLIPDTEKNVAALKSIHAAMERLGAQISELLSPERIQLTLASTKPVMLLTGGSSEAVK